MPIRKFITAVNAEIAATTPLRILAGFIVAVNIDAGMANQAAKDTAQQRVLITPESTHALRFKDLSFELSYRAADSNDITVYTFRYGRESLSGVFYQATQLSNGQTTYITSALPETFKGEQEYDVRLAAACRIAVNMATGDNPPAFIEDLNQNNALGQRFIHDFCL